MNLCIHLHGSFVVFLLNSMLLSLTRCGVRFLVKPHLVTLNVSRDVKLDTHSEGKGALLPISDDI